MQHSSKFVQALLFDGTLLSAANDGCVASSMLSHTHTHARTHTHNTLSFLPLLECSPHPTALCAHGAMAQHCKLCRLIQPIFTGTRIHASNFRSKVFMSSACSCLLSFAVYACCPMGTGSPAARMGWRVCGAMQSVCRSCRSPASLSGPSLRGT